MRPQTPFSSTQEVNFVPILAHEEQKCLEFGMLPKHAVTLISPGSDEFSATFRERGSPKRIILGMILFPLLITSFLGFVLAVM